MRLVADRGRKPYLPGKYGYSNNPLRRQLMLNHLANDPLVGYEPWPPRIRLFRRRRRLPLHPAVRWLLALAAVTLLFGCAMLGAVVFYSIFIKAY